MTENFLAGLAGIIIAGIGAQWLAWRLRLPSILLLLLAGFILGPVTNMVNPDELFGNLLFPTISLSVALILFEGGLSLKLTELPEMGWALLKLVSIGALATWAISAAAAHFILGLNPLLAILLGALVMVTGPTVTGPMLQYIRPKTKLNNLLKWEGIIIDPLGAMFAVLAFEVLMAGNLDNVQLVAITSIIRTIVFGGGIGALTAIGLIIMLRYYWIPDYLQNPLALMSVVLAFVLANSIQAESGLLAVTVMGITLVNQNSVSIKHIIEFKENLRVLLISGLFIILAARLRLSDLNYFSLRTLIFIAVLILIARPVAVFLSTIGNRYEWQERLFVAWLAPKGIVAAAVSSVLAISLIETGHPQAELLVPLTFITIIGTVVVYSLTSALLAHRLHVAQPNPQGVLFIGAHFWARSLAQALQGEGYQVRLVDRNRGNIKAARVAGLPVYYGNILAHQAIISVNLDGIGHLLALTANNEVNSLAALHFGDILGRSEVYQLPPPPQPGKDSETVSRDLRGRLLFNDKASYAYLAKRFTTGATIKVSRITNEFNYEDFLKLYGSSALPLFLINEVSGNLTIFTADTTLLPTTGQKLISLVDPIKEETKARQSGKGLL